MSGSINGHGLSRPPARATTAAVLAQHLEECSDKNQRVESRLGGVESGVLALKAEVGGLTVNVAELTGQLKIIVGMFIKERPQPDGPSQFVWHISMPSLKTIGKLILVLAGAFTGFVGIFQLSVVMLVPAIKAGLEFLMSYGH
jgi:hypothetical protein